MCVYIILQKLQHLHTVFFLFSKQMWYTAFPQNININL